MADTLDLIVGEALPKLPLRLRADVITIMIVYIGTIG